MLSKLAKKSHIQKKTKRQNCNNFDQKRGMVLPSRLRSDTKTETMTRLNVSLVFSVAFGVLVPFLFFCSLPFLPAGLVNDLSLDGARTSNETSASPSFLAYVQGSNIAALSVLASLGWLFNLIVLRHRGERDEAKELTRMEGDDPILLFARRRFIRISLASSLKVVLAATWLGFSALPLSWTSENVRLRYDLEHIGMTDLVVLTAQELIFQIVFQIGTSGTLFVLLFYQCWNCPRCRRRLGGFGPVCLLIAGCFLRNWHSSWSYSEFLGELLVSHAARIVDRHYVDSPETKSRNTPHWPSLTSLPPHHLHKTENSKH